MRTAGTCARPTRAATCGSSDSKDAAFGGSQLCGGGAGYGAKDAARNGLWSCAAAAAAGRCAVRNDTATQLNCGAAPSSASAGIVGAFGMPGGLTRVRAAYRGRVRAADGLPGGLRVRASLWCASGGLERVRAAYRGASAQPTGSLGCVSTRPGGARPRSRSGVPGVCASTRPGVLAHPRGRSGVLGECASTRPGKKLANLASWESARPRVPERKLRGLRRGPRPRCARRTRVG